MKFISISYHTREISPPPPKKTLFKFIALYAYPMIPYCIEIDGTCSVVINAQCGSASLRKWVTQLYSLEDADVTHQTNYR